MPDPGVRRKSTRKPAKHSASRAVNKPRKKTVMEKHKARPAGAFGKSNTRTRVKAPVTHLPSARGRTATKPRSKKTVMAKHQARPAGKFGKSNTRTRVKAPVTHLPSARGRSETAEAEAWLRQRKANAAKKRKALAASKKRGAARRRQR